MGGTNSVDTDTLKLTFLPLKNGGWEISLLLGLPIFRGYVSFREGN